MSPRIQIDLTNAITCHGPACSNAQDVCRHHKGFDSLIGRYNSGVASRYLLYLDCVPLCPECHCLIHYHYQKLVRSHRDWSASGVLKLRAKLIKYCDKWLAGNLKLKRPPKKFKQQFMRGYREWKKLNSLSK